MIDLDYFLVFDPYLTYAVKKDGEFWRESKSKSVDRRKSAKFAGDLSELWRLGGDAFALIPPVSDFDEFILRKREFDNCIADIRERALVAFSRPGNEDILDIFENSHAADVMFMVSTLHQRLRMKSLNPSYRCEMNAIACLTRLDIALGSIKFGVGSALRHSLAASNLLHLASSVQYRVALEKGLLTDFSKQNAKLRHKENHAIRDAAIQYWCANESKFSSIEDAAVAIAEKLVPMKPRTVARWISQERKKRKTQSAS